MGALVCCNSNDDKIKTLHATIKDQENEILMSKQKISQLEENSAMLIRNLEKEMMHNAGGGGVLPLSAAASSSSSSGGGAGSQQELRAAGPAGLGGAPNGNGNGASRPALAGTGGNGSFNDKKSSDLTERMKKLAATMTDFRQRNSKTSLETVESTPITQETKNMREFM